MGLIEDIFEQHIAVIRDSRGALRASIEAAAAMITACYRRGNKVVLFGNGGSMSDALHIEGELVCRFKKHRDGLPAITIGSGLSGLTAAANDYSYADALAHLVRAHARPGDVAVAISTSGDSPNVVNAAAAASERGAGIIALTGRSGGRLKEKADIVIAVPSSETPRIQEVHAVVGHILCEMVEDSLFG